MRLKRAVLGVALVAAIWSQPLGAQNNGSVQGVVKSAAGEPLSGAFVKLKNEERRLTFMVISQAQGRYTAKNLPPGKYIVQGVGNAFQSNWSAAADVVNGQPATVDVSLTAPQAPALPNAWPGRQPGQGGGEGGGGGSPAVLPDGAGKQIAEAKCSACHPASRIVGYNADRQRWIETLDDMKLYMQGSTRNINLTDPETNVLLDYLVKNFAEGEEGRRVTPKPDPNSRLPRTLLKGAATQYVAVEFEIPTNDTEPHEVTVDSDGNGWATQRRGGKLGRLDPKTLTYTELSPPPAASKTVQLNGIWAGKNNKLWFIDVGPNRRWLAYDTKTREFSTYNMSTKLNSGGAGGNTMRDHPNGTVWFNAIGNNTVIRLDLKSGEFTGFPVPSGVKAGKSASPYGMVIAGDGGVWVALNAVDKLARVDPDTGHMEEFDIPVKGAVPRKGGPDVDGNVWMGLHGAGKILKVDIHNNNKMTVYSPPTEDSGTYAISVDMKHNLIWVAQQHSDMIARFDPRTETWTEFPLANAEEDHRRIEVDQTNPNRIWWSGNTSNRMGYIEVFDSVAQQ
ncbi:MAG: carboxypeptidase regulatory-like domain-containing protein [Acidobacteria bacterium]|nr:carboxypeptidase regulatory-like domain-containing protein [Acidobacteriota bacterium]